MCPDCYDYQAAVLFNAHAADLWRRFVTYLPRHLARRLGVTQKFLHELVGFRFVKVAEYQARGVVHFHAIIRLDEPGDEYWPPPPEITALHDGRTVFVQGNVPSVDKFYREATVSVVVTC